MTKYSININNSLLLSFYLSGNEYESASYLDTTPITLKYQSANASYNNKNARGDLKINEMFDAQLFYSTNNKERKFALYEIDHPELRCGVHLQLFEKTITPQGKYLWNDLTKEEIARYTFCKIIQFYLYRINLCPRRGRSCSCRRS